MPRQIHQQLNSPFIRHNFINNQTTRFDLNINKEVVGYITIRQKYDNYSWMKDFCSKEFHNQLIPDNKYLELSQLYVYQKDRGKGYANRLMRYLDFIFPEHYPEAKQIFLFAFATEFNLPREILKEFYNKYKFEEIPFPIDYIIEKNQTYDCLDMQIEDSKYVLMRNLSVN